MCHSAKLGRQTGVNQFLECVLVNRSWQAECFLTSLVFERKNSFKTWGNRGKLKLPTGVELSSHRRCCIRLKENENFPETSWHLIVSPPSGERLNDLVGRLCWCLHVYTKSTVYYGYLPNLNLRYFHLYVEILLAQPGEEPAVVCSQNGSWFGSCPG